MKIKIKKDREVLKDLKIEKGKSYEVDSVVVDSYKIKVPMKRQGKYKYALIGEDEGKLLDE